MRSFSCSKQEEVMAALREGRWPRECLPALHAHVAACRECSDLVLVAETLRQARGETMQETISAPGLVSPGTLWWRSELRRRSGAVERISKPIAVAEKLALMAIPLALLGLIVWQWDQITGWFIWLTDSSNALHSTDLAAATPATTEVISLVLIASLGGFILISMLALFLLTDKE